MRGTAGWSASADNESQSSRAVPCHLLVKGNGFSFAVGHRFTSHLRWCFPLQGKPVRDIAQLADPAINQRQEGAPDWRLALELKLESVEFAPFAGHTEWF